MTQQTRVLKDVPTNTRSSIYKLVLLGAIWRAFRDLKVSAKLERPTISSTATMPLSLTKDL